MTTANQAPSHAGPPSWSEIADLVATFDAGTYADVDLQLPGFRLRMSTNPDAASQMLAAPLPTEPPAGTQPVAAPAPDVQSPPTVSDLVEVTAPMLGTFYSKPSPDADAFVAIGSTVAADTTVAIIEVMKLMNPVTAGRSGRVVEILVSDGDLVQFGQALFRMAPDEAAP